MRKWFVAGAAAAVLACALMQAPARAGAVSSVSCNSPCTTLTIDVENIRSMNDLLFVSLWFLPPATNVAGGMTATINTNSGNTTVQSGVAIKRTLNGALINPPAADFTIDTLAGIIYDGTEFVEVTPATLASLGVANAFTGNNSLAGTTAWTGSLFVPARTATGTSDTISATTDYFVCADNGSAAATETLPASPTSGLTFVIKDCSGSAATNSITISGNGKNIDGASTLVLSGIPYQSVGVTYNGSQWSAN